MADEALVTVTIPFKTGNPRDVSQNNFVFKGADTDAKRELIFDSLIDFYRALVGSTGQNPQQYLSPVLDTTANVCSMKYYDISGHLDGSAHGSPIDSRLWTLGAPAAGSGLPSEVSCALTLEGLAWWALPVEQPGVAPPEPPPAIRPRSRHKGRLFLPPLNVTCVATVANVVRPSQLFMDTWIGSAKRMQDALDAGGVEWGIWSRANADVYLLESVSMDNSFDTQRRRGEASTARTRSVVPI